MTPSLRLFPDYPAPRVLGLAGRRSPVGELVEQVRAEIDHHGTMLAVVPSRDADEVLRDLLVVRNALGANRMVLVRTGLPPLATAVLASQLAAVETELQSAGQLLAGVAMLQKQMVVLAWLSRVDRLDHPRVRLGLHAQSLVPGTRFAVGVQPEPYVRRIVRDQPPPPGFRAGGGPWLAVLAPSGDARWLREAALPPMAIQRVIEVDAPPLSQRWWGSRRASELVACPDSPALIARWITDSRPCTPCAWCGEPVNGPRCPVCSMVLTGMETAGGVR